MVSDQECQQLVAEESLTTEELKEEKSCQHKKMRKLSWDSIKCSSEFKKVTTGGVKFITPIFIVFSLKEKDNSAKLGIIASRKVGSAINRNRAKRLIRVAFSELKLHGISVVFIVRHSTPDATYEEVLRWMKKWQKSLNKENTKDTAKIIRYMA
jgi:ribonuclease P protein component